jgi:hypothetical protein
MMRLLLVSAVCAFAMEEGGGSAASWSGDWRGGWGEWRGGWGGSHSWQSGWSDASWTDVAAASASASVVADDDEGKKKPKTKLACCWCKVEHACQWLYLIYIGDWQGGVQLLARWASRDQMRQGSRMSLCEKIAPAASHTPQRASPRSFVGS